VIKAIIFDVDGVLVDSKNANVALFQKILQKAGYSESSREEILKYFHLPLWQALEKLTGSDDQKEIERVWNLAKDPSMRDNTLLNFPDKLEYILEELHKRYKLAIVTSRIRVGIEDIFNAREIKHLFDAVVTFEDVKNPKPHPEPLLLALEKLNLSSNEAMYIGDSATDIDAAKAANMRSIYLSPIKHNDATANILQFNELLNAVEHISNL